MENFLLFFFAAYGLFMIGLLFGWAKAQEVEFKSDPVNRFITVVIPFRNEVQNLKNILGDLKTQKYADFEVVLVNDHSDDGSEKLVQPLVADRTLFRLISLKEKSGKKNALARGIEEARGEIIVTTDADCRVSPAWLSQINQGFVEKKTKMLIGLVKSVPEENFFERLQAMELSSLAAVTGATLGMGFPTMCNGANLAFRKVAFHQVGGYQDNIAVASGDDDFLMRKFYTQWADGVRFLPGPDAVVITAPQPTWLGFIQQRMRWAGKWRYNSSALVKVTALFVLSFHSAVIITFLALFCGWISLKWAAYLFASKFFLEAILLQSAGRFLKTKWSWLIFIVLQFIYPFYVVAIGFASQFIKSEWKGRK